jgi:capsular polysaccharide biosynthesis protein
VTATEREPAPLPLRSLLIRGLPLAIVCSIGCAILAGVLSEQRASVYTAKALVLLRLTPDPINSSSSQVLEGQGVPTESLLVKRRVSLARVAHEMPGVTVDDLERDVSVSQVPKTNALWVTATAERADQAAEIANRVAATFVADQRANTIRRARDARRVLQRQLAALSSAERQSGASAQLRAQIQNLRLVEGTSSSSPRLVDSAAPPSSATSPRPRRDALFGAIFGFVLGMGLGAWWVASDRRVRDPEEVAEVLGAPALATIPRRRGLFRRAARREARAQALRLLHLGLRFGPDGERLRTVSVTTLGDDAVRSDVAWGLAATAAATGQRALLIAVQPQMKVLNGHLGEAAAEHRLDALLAGDATLAEAASPAQLGSNGSGHLDVVTSGPANGRPSELAFSPRLGDAIREAAAAYELVVIDTPSVLERIEGLAVVSEADGTLVVLPERPDRDKLLALHARLEALRARVVGVVFGP